LLLAAPAAAQLTTGTITGTVKDIQGSVIPGATVVLTSQSRGTSLPPVFSSEAGLFVVVNVPPDTYDLTVSLEGFKTLKRGPIALSAGDQLGVATLSLDVGVLSETITVRRQALS
jgi:hypothetical protein